MCNEATWRVIKSEEDLPKEEGEYWWTTRVAGRVVRNGYNGRIDSAQYLAAYMAWMPITEPAPYTPQEGGENAS